MSQRNNVLLALRQWGEPVSVAVLAGWMNRPRRWVANDLSALYARDIVDRFPHPRHRSCFLYCAKALDA